MKERGKGAREILRERGREKTGEGERELVGRRREKWNWMGSVGRGKGESDGSVGREKEIEWECVRRKGKWMGRYWKRESELDIYPSRSQITANSLHAIERSQW